MCLDGDGTMYSLGIRSRRVRREIPCVVALIQIDTPLPCQDHPSG